MPERPETSKQWALIHQWLDSLKRLPEIDVIWLEGSLVGDHANPSSDIDLRFSINDEAYHQLWETDRTPLLAGLGEHLLLIDTFIRALTAEGLVVEASAYKTSQLDSLALPEWEILFCRLPGGAPKFQKLPEQSPAELWPMKDKLTVEHIRNLTNLFLLVLAQAPATLYSNELHSARYVLDDTRTNIIRLMYRRLGLQYAKRYKHFSQVLPPEWLADLDRTYMRSEASPFDTSAIAKALIETFDVLGKQLAALSDQVGGGFEPDWYQRLHRQVTDQLNRF